MRTTFLSEDTPVGGLWETGLGSQVGTRSEKTLNARTESLSLTHGHWGVTEGFHLG